MKLFCEYDRFELEQDIIKLWETNEAIEELIRQHLDRPEGPFSDDEFANRLDGIRYVNDLKLQRLWDGFEMMIKNKHFAKTRFGDASEVAVPNTNDDKLFEILTKKKGNKKK
jgi:UV DNA damage repair endonuclease